MASTRRGLTNGLGGGRGAPFPAPSGRVNGTHRGATNGMRADGKVNGLRNGGGRVNGLVNGTRAQGSRGRINGNGLVNGSGFTNGLTLRRNAFGIVTHRDLRRGGALLAVSLLLMVVLGFLLSAPPPAPSPFAVDGDFREWAGVVQYSDPPDAEPAHADLVAYAVHATEDRLHVYGRTREPPFQGREATSVYVVLNRNGGGPAYAAPGLGAHAIAEVWGWDGALQRASLRVWNGSADADDATGFRDAGPMRAALAGTEFELAVEGFAFALPEDPADLSVLLAVRSSGGLDLGAIVGPRPGALLVHQEPLGTTVDAGDAILRITMRALRADVRVHGITLVRSGVGILEQPDFDFTIPADGERVETIRLAGGASRGSFLTVRVTGVDASAPVTLTGQPARAYVQEAPAGVAVDGLFDDWVGVENATDPLDGALSDSVDLRETATAIQGGPFFYVRTRGGVLAGAILPERRVPIVPGGEAGEPAPPTPILRRAGEDVLQIYVDTDDRDARGERFGNLVADRLLEVRGRLGRITAKTLFAWDPAASAWSPRTGPFDAEFAGTQFEASAPATFFGAMRNPRVAFAMSDWSGATDVSEVAGLRGTRGSPGMEPLHGTNAETIQATALTNVPVIDGNCATTGGEYDGANTGSSTGLTFRVGRRSDTQHVYVCIEVTGDTSNSMSDWGELVFDRSHDGGTAPQADDRRFRVLSGSTVLVRQKGNGVDWEACGSDCDASDSGAGAFRTDRQVYEFRIRFSDVWGTNSPSANQVAGFAVVALDANTGTTYFWGSQSVSDTNPNSWGHLEIPEFAPIGVAAAAALLLPLVRRRQSLYSARRMRTR